MTVCARDLLAKDAENNLVTIKKIEQAFSHKIFMHRTLRTLKIKRLLKHENILAIKDVSIPDNLEECKDIYVIHELMETDLA